MKAGKATRTTLVSLGAAADAGTRVGVSQAAFARLLRVSVRIPAELAYSSWNMDLVIEREGDELRIRPAPRRMGDVLGKLAKFSPDFMAEGRGTNIEGQREAL